MPAHSQISGALTYQSQRALTPGTLVRVPLGRRQTLGIVWGPAEQVADEAPVLRDIDAALDELPPLSAAWRELVDFAARYYQRGVGEIALAAMPPALRTCTPVQLQRRLQRRTIRRMATADTEPLESPHPPSDNQLQALQQIDAASGELAAILLHGVTGSGKTEVYLRAVADLFDREPQAQALVMVPEINLTPQVVAQFVRRFGAGRVTCMHSAMTPAQRLQAWLDAHLGTARIVLGTRLAIWAPMPKLRLIIVDEEHDPSYKQHEGARYSSRDLAVMRGRIEGARVLLGSATPSLESWYLSRPAVDGGRYLRVIMGDRAQSASKHPRLRLASPPTTRAGHGLLDTALLQAIADRARAGQQTLLLINRRGYAPVLDCSSCGWKSECPHCSAFRVFHKPDRTLRCHHCGYTEAVPRACPACGNPDIRPVGRGTQRVEEELAEELSTLRGAQDQPLRILRIDADTARGSGQLVQRLQQAHDGEADVLVGTQMIAKGHDFRRVTLVAALEGDSALYSSDFRASERWFSLLLQAAGRAGRAPMQARAMPSELWVQTREPRHALYQALSRMETSAIEAYEQFANRLLHERQQAGLPPFMHQALLRADAPDQASAQAWLTDATAAAPEAPSVRLYSPVPLAIARIANVERAQLLVESPSRVALQGFLAEWRPALHHLRFAPRHRRLLRWAIDVDPVSI